LGAKRLVGLRPAGWCRDKLADVRPITELNAIVTSPTVELNKKAHTPAVLVEEWSSSNTGRMYMNHETRELNDTELEVVAGGSCETALNMASVYTALSAVLNAGGETTEGAKYAGMALGVIQGGCS
jgi:hypothetical protein